MKHSTISKIIACLVESNRRDLAEKLITSINPEEKFHLPLTQKIVDKIERLSQIEYGARKNVKVAKDRERLFKYHRKGNNINYDTVEYYDDLLVKASKIKLNLWNKFKGNFIETVEEVKKYAPDVAKQIVQLRGEGQL